MDAVNTPVRRPSRERHTDDLPVSKKPAIESRDDLIGEVVEAPEALHKEYLEVLAFMEEPVTIRIERSSEKFAPPMIPCWVNGKGAEVFTNGKWVAQGHLPVGVPITTKRKYVEVLVAAKIDSVQTKVQKFEDHEKNMIERFPSSTAPLSILEDRSPKGAAWFAGLARRG